MIYEEYPRYINLFNQCYSSTIFDIRNKLSYERNENRTFIKIEL